MPAAAQVAPETLFQAFADPTRRRLLNLMRAGEVCVGDLTTIIDAPQPTISRHLAALRRAGLVVVEKEGTWCFYRLAEPGSDLHEHLLEGLASCVAASPPLRRDAAALARLRRRGGCCTRESVARCGPPAKTRKGT